MDLEQDQTQVAEPVTPAPVPESTDAKATAADPSTAPDAKDPAAAPSVADAKDAKPEKPLDITRRVMGNKAKAAAPSTVAKDPAATAEAQAAADKDLPFHDHPRWKEVVAQRNDFEKRAATAEAAAGQFKEGAERHQQIVDFMEGNGLVADEMSELMKFGAMAKSDDPAVLENCANALLQIADEVLVSIGKRLPKDLQEKVDAGLIEKDAALEMAGLRGKTQTLTAKVDQSAQAQDARQKHEIDTAVSTACVNWENATKAKDLNYNDHKSRLVAAEVSRLIAESGGKKPRSYQAANALMNKAYKNVNENLVGAQGRAPKPEISTSRSTTASAPGVRPDTSKMSPIEITRGIMAGTIQPGT